MKPRYLFALLTFLSACFALAVIPNDAAATSSLPPVTEAVSAHSFNPQSAGSWAAPNSGNPQSVDTPTPLPTATPTSTASCPLAWRIVPAADSATPNTLNGVAAIAWNDVWAVGVGGQGGVTLMQHWNGNQWATPVSTPHVGFSEVLDAVSALASNDVWAVGKYLSGSSEQTLTMHWDGAAWTIVPSPSPDAGAAYLAVSMLASNYVWAVGYTNNGTSTSTLTALYSPVGCGTSTPTPTPTGTHTPTYAPTTSTPTARLLFDSPKSKVQGS